MRSSMTLRARANRPTSVGSSAPGTRWSRLPAAMESAVRSTSSSGRRPRRTNHQPPVMASTSAPAVTASSMSNSSCRVLVMSPMGSATTIRPFSLAPVVRLVSGVLVDLDPEGRAAGLLGPGGEEGGRRAVGLGGEAAEMSGQLGAVGVGPDVGGALQAVDQLARVGQHLEVGRRTEVGRATAAAAARGWLLTGAAGASAAAAAAAAEEAVGRRAGARVDETARPAAGSATGSGRPGCRARSAGPSRWRSQPPPAPRRRWPPRPGEVGGGATLRRIRWTIQTPAGCSRPDGWCG